MFRHITLAKTNFQKNQKLKNDPQNPPKTKNQRSALCSELMLKTKMFRHITLVNKIFKRNQKLKNYPLNPSKTKIQRSDLVI